MAQKQYVLDGGSYPFIPRGVDNNLATWARDDGGSGVPIRQSKMTVSMRAPAKGQKTYRFVLKFVVPHAAATGTSSASGYVPDEKVSHFETAEVTFIVSDKSTIQDRAGILQLVSDACSLDHPVMKRALAEFQVIDYDDDVVT